MTIRSSAWWSKTHKDGRYLRYPSEPFLSPVSTSFRSHACACTANCNGFVRLLIGGGGAEFRSPTLRYHKVLDRNLAQSIRIALACASSFDYTLRDDFVYWIVAVADMESQ